MGGHQRPLLNCQSKQYMMCLLNMAVFLNPDPVPKAETCNEMFSVIAACHYAKMGVIECSSVRGRPKGIEIIAFKRLEVSFCSYNV